MDVIYWINKNNIRSGSAELFLRPENKKCNKMGVSVSPRLTSGVYLQTGDNERVECTRKDTTRKITSST
jgi:hypothetical protein